MSLGELRSRGANPDAVVGWLASTCGLAAPGETLSPRALLPRFDLAAVPTEATVVSAQDLRRLEACAGRR